MPTHTINLSYEEDGAAILILRGIHHIEPIGNFRIVTDFDFMFPRTDEVMSILLGYERAYENAKLDGNINDDNVLWRYVHDELIGDEDTGFEHEEFNPESVEASFREKYLHGTGR